MTTHVRSSIYYAIEISMHIMIKKGKNEITTTVSAAKITSPKSSNCRTNYLEACNCKNNSSSLQIEESRLSARRCTL